MNISKAGTNKSVFKNFYSENNKQNIQFLQSKASKTNSKLIDVPVMATTIAGVLIPMFVIRKYQGKKLSKGVLNNKDLSFKTKAVLKSFSLNYGLKEMIFTSFGSVLGGLAGGLIFDKNENKNKKAKIKESVFQFSNILIPTSIVGGLLKISAKIKKSNNIFLKLAPVLLGIATGMPLAAAISDKISGAFIDKNNMNKRKIELKDCFVHADDLIGALVLAKIPFANKLHVDKVLPVLYGVCGYEAGIKK